MTLEQKEMNLNTYRECFNICDKVRKSRPKKKIQFRDYPAAVVSCAESIQNYNHFCFGYSGKVDSSSYSRTPALESVLLSLGPIGQIRNGCRNYIGACAEPHAARAVVDGLVDIDVLDLFFSYAYRPRTKSVLRYCKNCTDIFNVKNP